MKRSISSLSALSLLVLLSTWEIMASGLQLGGNGNNSWDYLLYVAQWAGTEGWNAEIPKDVRSFTIHGVWPQRNDGTYPSSCNSSVPFNKKEIESLVDELEKIWYSYPKYGHDSLWLWEHEWEKHGTCAMNEKLLATQYEYFDAGIKLHATIGLDEALKDAGIVPSKNATYTTESVIAAIRKRLGVSPGSLSCSSVGDYKHALDVIEICVNKKLQVMECPKSLFTLEAITQRRAGTSSPYVSCGFEVFFPPVPSSKSVLPEM